MLRAKMAEALSIPRFMRRFAPIYAAVLFVSATTAVMARQAVQQSPQQVAAALQARYDSVRDFTADFTQQDESGILRKKLTERGKLQIKKPGKMRWDYTAPDKKLFVSDGTRIYLWVPADNQVTVSAVPERG